MRGSNLRKKILLILVLLLPTLIYADLQGPELVDEVLRDHKEWIYKKYGFVPLYRGLGVPCGHVNSVSVCFRRSFDLSIPESREICVICMEDLLTRINASRPLRPFLQKYPFAFENLRYSLAFDRQKSEQNTPLIQTSVYSVFSCGGKIYYDMNDDDGNDLNKIISEDFNKARQMVIESRSQGF